MHLLIHVFLDNARYYYTKFVWEWLARPGRRIKLHFIPFYYPHPNPIERLWASCTRMPRRMRTIRGHHARSLARQISKYLASFQDLVTDNFRATNPRDCSGSDVNEA
jgi:hypothetical protein